MEVRALDLQLTGMTCAACAARIEKVLNRADGVKAAVNFATETAHVEFDPARSTPEALIDPAAYHGHREAELGMMLLFGGFGAAVLAAYQEAWPLEPGWRERVELYGLYHLLNHFNLFGGGYGRQALRVAARFG